MRSPSSQNSPTGFDDEPPSWTGDSGLLESLSKSILGGVVVPVILLGVAGVIVWAGEIILSSETPVRFCNQWSIWSAVTFLAGVATIFVARFGLQNWLPDRYVYQPVAIAGVVAVILGTLVFVLAGL